MAENQDMYCQWEDEDWDTLIYAISQNNCILMLGPDIAADNSDSQPHLLTETLANGLARDIDQETLKRINCSDLSQVSQHYAAAKGRDSLEGKVFAFYKKKKDIRDRLHRDLAKLPFYFTITTTLDSIFCNALKENNKEPITEWYNFRTATSGIAAMGTKEKPLVYYLYGSIEERTSLVLTENDLLDFLVTLISKERPLPENIRSELRDENKIFLFLGFGFRHWYLRILLHVLLQERKKTATTQRRSFALEHFPPEDTNELQQTAFYFKKSDYRIYILGKDFNDFAAELKKRYEECEPDVVIRKKEAEMPEVFICHASEDKDYAASLYKTLEQAGIRPWLDKENLRGAEEWDNKIRDTVKKIDYVVVLQSQALANKPIGYVNREINIALDRQQEFQKGKFAFIIPVKIEPCPLREDLQHLHTTDLTGENGVKTLIDIIQRDFEKRKK